MRNDHRVAGQSSRVAYLRARVESGSAMLPATDADQLRVSSLGRRWWLAASKSAVTGPCRSATHVLRLFEELLTRQPHRHRRRLCRLPAKRDRQSRNLHGGVEVPGWIEFVAGLVIVLLAILLGLRAAELVGLAHDVQALFDRERRNARLREAEVIRAIVRALLRSLVR